MIIVNDLHKSFKAKTGTVHAVQGVSFTANDGEITGLLGPNGAGKTTYRPSPSEESRAERERRLFRECRGMPNAGACRGFTQR